MDYTYKLIVDKCVRMKLLPEALDLSAVPKASRDDTLAAALVPAFEKLLQKGLFSLYQVLYDIDVDERIIKEKLMDLNNMSMLTSIVAYAVIDRLKIRYHDYHKLLHA